jgi:hypothetical protein
MNGRKARGKRKTLLLTGQPVDPVAYRQQPYVSEMLAAAGRARVGEVTHVMIYHDDWCAIFEGGLCNCNPDVEAVRQSEVQ